LRLLISRRVLRWETGRFVAEGPKLLEEALAAGAGVETVFVDPSAASAAHRHLADRAAAAGAEILEVQSGVLARACDAVSPQPLAAVVSMVHVPLDGLPDGGLTLICAGLADPGNAGTVVRSAAAAGSRAVVFCAGAVDIYNPKAVRASAGALFHLPIVAGPEPATVLDHFAERGIRRIATRARGGEDHDRIDWMTPSALFLGSESHGLPAGLDERIDAAVTIPMRSSSESLNVAGAAAVICFEADRQRRGAGSPRP
jgi:TrmH family RNA methyltransferase